MRRAAVAIGVAALLTGCGGGGGGGGARRPGQTPIVFVHGLGGTPAAWTAMAARFRADGRQPDELDAWGYDSRLSNRVIARRLAAEVTRVRRRTGAARVDLITHSMGALSSRWWMRRLGGARLVRHWVSLGGPNHGIAGPPLCGFVSCRELQAGSRLLRVLDAGDPTPGGTRYATWWSPCDRVIAPHTSVRLRGARNTRTACLSHSALLTDRRVYEQVRAFLGS